MNFVNILTLFSEKSERNIEKLSKIYDNKILLSEKILNVGKGYLDNGEIITGKKIFLKPNWVMHNRKEADEFCLRTNNNFLLAVVGILLENKPSSILIGDAPIQGCNWGKMLSKQFYETITALSTQHSVPIKIKDFRRVTFSPDLNNPVKERNPLSDYIIFDLGTESFLEPVSSDKNIFRVTSYNPDRLQESHRKGIHKYCITRELFEADIIISLPKIKTHQKSGITGALKNIVGLNGDKDYLPHHRVGGTGFGGDCYPGKNVLRRLAEFFMDKANRKQGHNIYWVWLRLALFLWKLSRPQNVHHIAAGWYGNDTIWRMVLDLNLISIFGKADGTLSGQPQRMLYSLCDGIIGGEGNGPLDPVPFPLGIISFTNCSELNDICMATIMNFDIRKIPLLNFSNNKIHQSNVSINLNGKQTSLEDLKKISIDTLPPPGWQGYL